MIMPPIPTWLFDPFDSSWDEDKKRIYIESLLIDDAAKALFAGKSKDISSVEFKDDHVEIILENQTIRPLE